MQKTSKKNTFTDTFFLVTAFIIVMVGMFLPKTGPYVLVDEIFDVLLFWIIAIYLVCKTVGIRKTGTQVQKKARIIVAIVGVILCIWISKNVVADIVSETKQVVLHNITVSRYQGLAGLLTVRYYMMGEDEAGNRVRFEISADDYTKYMYGDTVKIIYYPKTDRVVELQ